MSDKNAPTHRYYKVMAIAPKGHYRVHGHHFDQNWKVVEVGTTDIFNAQIETISTQPFKKEGALPNAAVMPSTFSEIMKVSQPRKVNPAHPRSEIAPPMLAVLPATDDDVKEYLANSGRKLDRVEEVEAQLAKERAKNADLEARMLRLEVQAAKEKPAKG